MARRDSVAVAEMQTRLEACVREAHVLSSTLERLGVPCPAAHDAGGGGGATATIARVRALELAAAEGEKQREMLEARLHAALRRTSVGDGGGGDRDSDEYVAGLRYSMLYAPQQEAEARRRNSAPDGVPHSRAQHDLAKTIRKVFKLQRALKARGQHLQAAERTLMQRHDIIAKLEGDNAHLTRSVEILQRKLADGEKKAPPPPPQDTARYDLVFSRRFDVSATDDEYTEAIVRRSSYAEPLTKVKAELKASLEGLWAKQDAALKRLWNAVNVAGAVGVGAAAAATAAGPGAPCPKSDAHKAVQESQRRMKVVFNHVAREMNAMVKAVVDKEKRAATDFVAAYEAEKARGREHASTMCVVPDPPPPVVRAQQARLGSFAEERAVLEEQVAQLEERQAALVAECERLHAAGLAAHTSMYQSLKAIWTHRYKFCSGVEDSVRAAVALANPGRSHYAKEALTHQFSCTHETVLRRDVGLLAQLAKYLTSEHLYKKDMLVEARVLKEDEARRRHSAAPPKERRRSKEPTVAAAAAAASAAPPALASALQKSAAWEGEQEVPAEVVRSSTGGAPDGGAGCGHADADADGRPSSRNTAEDLQHAAVAAAEADADEEEPQPCRFVRFVDEQAEAASAATPSTVQAWDGQHRKESSAGVKGAAAGFVPADSLVSAAAGGAPCFTAGGGNVCVAAKGLRRLVRTSSITFECGVAPQDELGRPTAKHR